MNEGQERRKRCRVCAAPLPAKGLGQRGPAKSLYCSRPCTARAEKLRTHGLSVEDYEALLATQGGGCAICRSTQGTKTGQRLGVDHDTRHLLCFGCLMLLRRFRRRPELMPVIARYLHAEAKQSA